MRVSLNEASQSIWQANNLEHLRYEYNLQPSDIVIDLGAYRGEWADEIKRRYGCSPLAVEPTNAIDGYEGEKVKQVAWVADGKVAVGGAYYYTSLFEDTTHEYEAFDINELLRGFSDIALVKMNVEGSEYPLLDHVINHGYHTRIRNLQVQFHLIEGQPWAAWYTNLAARLSASHFTTFKYDFCWENWQRNA